MHSYTHSTQYLHTVHWYSHFKLTFLFAYGIKCIWWRVESIACATTEENRRMCSMYEYIAHMNMNTYNGIVDTTIIIMCILCTAYSVHKREFNRFCINLQLDIFIVSTHSMV